LATTEIRIYRRLAMLASQNHHYAPSNHTTQHTY